MNQDDETLSAFKESPFGRKLIIETFKLIGEILAVLLWQILYILVAIYRIFVQPNEESVAGKIVLITGTGSGIGRETALQYGRAGAVVVCVDRRDVNNRETVQSIERNGGRAYHFVCDVADREAIQTLVVEVRRTIGVVTVLVINARVRPLKPLLLLTEREIRQVVNINVMGGLWMIQAFLPDMLAQQKGHIVAICSTAALSGIPNLVAYCSSQYAIRGVMDALIEEMRHDSPYIKFTTIYPHLVEKVQYCRSEPIRFAIAKPIVTTEEVAKTIVSSQRRGLIHVSVPRYYLYREAFTKAMPIKCRHLLYGYLKNGKLD